MSKLFDFLKTASKAIDDVEHVVNKVNRIADEISTHIDEIKITNDQPKSYAAMLEQYQDSLLQDGTQEVHNMEAYMHNPPFKITYTLPNASRYTDEGTYGAGEIYEGYSYQNYKVANLLYSFELGVKDVSEDELLNRFSKIYGPMNVIEYRYLDDQRFDKRMELDNDKHHFILYVYGSMPGNYLFAECQIHKEELSEQEQVSIMKDFEDMIASIQYSK